jgi:hypothetical protein
MAIKLLFSDTETLVSKLIKLVTGSKYSHVEFVSYEHTPKITLIGSGFGGVKSIPLDKRLEVANNLACYEMDCNYYDFLKIIKSQSGKKYDYMALLGFLFKRNWQDPDRWFCSELVLTCYNDITNSSELTQTWSVSPQDLIDSGLLKSSCLVVGKRLVC